MIKVQCELCKKEYETYLAWYKKRKHHFCSLSCKYDWNQTLQGYWKGKKIPFYKRPNRDVSGSKNGRWKGGRRIDKDGYILIWNPKHPYSDFHGYVREHRLVMEQHIERILTPTEVVHHENFNKQDNRIENLKLISSLSEHQKLHNEIRRSKKS